MTDAEALQPPGGAWPKGGRGSRGLSALKSSCPSGARSTCAWMGRGHQASLLACSRRSLPAHSAPAGCGGEQAPEALPSGALHVEEVKTQVGQRRRGQGSGARLTDSGGPGRPLDAWALKEE